MIGTKVEQSLENMVSDAELGDKTQLATIAIATRFPTNFVGILMGTTTGMLIADAIETVVCIKRFLREL